MALTPVSESKLRQYVLRVAERHQGHPEYDDLLAAAFAGMWVSVRRARRSNACSDRAAAINGARWGISEFLKRWRREQAERPLSLDENQARLDGDDPLPIFPEPVAADDYEPLLDRLEAAAAWQRVCAYCSPPERRLIWECVVRNRSFGEVGRELGIGRDAVSGRLKGALSRCRKDQAACG